MCFTMWCFIEERIAPTRYCAIERMNNSILYISLTISYVVIADVVSSCLVEAVAMAISHILSVICNMCGLKEVKTPKDAIGVVMRP